VKSREDDSNHESDYREEGVRQNGAAIVCGRKCGG